MSPSYQCLTKSKVCKSQKAHCNHNKRKLMEVNPLVRQKHDISVYELNTLQDKFTVQGKDRTCG